MVALVIIQSNEFFTVLILAMRNIDLIILVERNLGLVPVSFITRLLYGQIVANFWD